MLPSLHFRLCAFLIMLVAVGCGDDARPADLVDASVPPASTCGNGVVDPGEACDLGAANSDTAANACRTSCVLASCGDGVIDTRESCDDGAANSDTVDGACRTTCALASCGDGTIDDGEACDQGAANSDTAANACRTTCTTATCGDGAVDNGEACDSGAANSDVAPDACRTTCALASCGDGVIDTGESCDDGPGNSDSVVGACRTTCALATCGDGTIDDGEACDDGAANSDTAPNACRTTCTSATCGDGVVDTGESCDGGAANSDDAPDTCRTTCAMPTCGDGVVDLAAGEHCDLGAANSDAPGSTCLTTCRGLWKFVSMPDFLGHDLGDVSALTDAVNSTNAFHERAIAFVLDAIAAEDPDFVLVAGNLVGGAWHSDVDDVGVFGPVSTLAEKEAAIQVAAATYYPQWLQRFAARDLAVHASLGDQDLGGAPWPGSFERSYLVDDYKRAWARHLTSLPGDQARYAERPIGTDVESTAYAFRHKNMLVLTADVFRYEEGADLGAQGSVALDIGADQLAWMNQVFTAAAADPRIEYLVVQGHVPVIKPVRFLASKNLGLDGGSTSPFWQALAAAGVDLYLSGQAHAMTASGADGVEQVSHGGRLGSPQARTVSYLVGSVYPDRIELELKWIDVSYPTDPGLLWQTGSERPAAELHLDEASGFTTAGTMVLDHAGAAPVARDRTGYFLRFGEQAAPGLMVHLPLDEAESTRTPNLGFSTALHRGTLTGGTFAPGIVGNGLVLAAGERVAAGPTPISSSRPRTVSVWIKATAGAGVSTVLAFGRNNSGAKWDVDVDHASGGVVELGVGGGRTNGAGSTSVTDGAWHHVAMVLPDGGDSLDDVQIYVDGVAIASTAATTAISTAGEAADQTVSERQLILGHSANGSASQPYTGELDDVAIWSRGLGATEVRALVSLATTPGLGYHAGQVDAVLAAFAAQRDVTVGGRTWAYQASGLAGAEGVVVVPEPGIYRLNLGAGAGFVSP